MMRQTGPMRAVPSRIEDLMGLASGDEKHDPSTRSTLDVLWVLYDRILRVDPREPRAEDRDRFVLSKGHGPLGLYAILADKGFFPESELSRFLTWDGILGGHPDRDRVPGIETSTGSLGHGFPMAIGMALAMRAKGVDRRVIVLVGDGEANEGTVWESALLAGDLGLANLTAVFIDNGSSTRTLGDVGANFSAFGWIARTVDGRDHAALEAALGGQDPAHPTIVVARIAD